METDCACGFEWYSWIVRVSEWDEGEEIDSNWLNWRGDYCRACCRYEDAVRARETDRAKIDQLLVTLSNIEAEINLLKRRIAELEGEVKRIKQENQRLMSELTRARTVAIEHDIRIVTQTDICRIWIRRLWTESTTRIRCRLCSRKSTSCVAFTTTKLKSSRFISNYDSKTQLGFRLWPLATRPPRIANTSRTSCPLQSGTFARSTTNSPMSTETTWNPGIDSKCRRYRHRVLDRQVHNITVLWAVRRDFFAEKWL